MTCDERDERLCELLKCLLRRGGAIEPEFEKRLRAAGLDLDHSENASKATAPTSARRADNDG